MPPMSESGSQLRVYLCGTTPGFASIVGEEGPHGNRRCTARRGIRLSTRAQDQESSMRTSSLWPVARLSSVGAFALVVVAGATRLQAQKPLAPAQVEARRDSILNAQADRLEAEASKWLGRPDKYFDVARLYRRAGLLRGKNPKSVEDFSSSAWAYSAAGDNSLARQMMEMSAEQATAVGDVERAANAFIDAALIALKDGREDKVPVLLRRMRAVLDSPLISSERRDQIIRRIEETGTLAKANQAP